MDLFISHESALEYWRQPAKRQQFETLKHVRKKLPPVLPEISEYQKEGPEGLSLPLTVLVGSNKAERKTKTIRTHVHSSTLPEGSWLQIGEGLGISSPEFCFFQMAMELPLIKLIELGFEFCGTYSTVMAERAGIEENDEPDESPYNLPTLTNTKALKSYVESMKGVRGYKKAARALQYIADGSASPMETALFMLLTLPYQLGGYGLPMPELNHLVNPSKASRANVHKDYYKCDIYWDVIKLNIEYDSEKLHSEETAIANDAKRRLDLATLGIETITVTNEQVRSVGELDLLAQHLATRLKKRLRYKEAQFIKQRLDLRNTLL